MAFKKSYLILIHLIILLILFSACKKNNIEPEPELPYIPEWIKIRETSEYDYINNIDFSDDNFGLISSTGKLFKTVDGGVTWEKIELGFDQVFHRAVALNKNIFAVGGSSLFVTKDGGKSFSEVRQHKASLYIIHSVKLINEDTWYVGESNELYKTVDGGVNWDIVHHFDGGPHLYGIHFINSTLFYAYGGTTSEEWLGGGKIYSIGFLSKTIDGGNTWTDTQDTLITTWAISGISFPGANVGYAVNGNRKLYKTTNGGYNWEYISTPGRNSHLLLFISEHTGYYPEGNKLYKQLMEV